jgi:hypothetical protein
MELSLIWGKVMVTLKIFRYILGMPDLAQIWGGGVYMYLYVHT